MKDAVRSISSPRYHAVRFYETEESLSQIVAEFLGSGLAAGKPAVVIATPAQRAAIVRALVVRSVDVVRLQRSGDLTLLDAEDTLSTFMTNGEPDAEVFRDSMFAVIKKASRERANCTVQLYGQMVDVLWKDGKCTAAIRLEMLWNQLANTHDFSLLCGYSMGHFYKDAAFDDICGHHTHVISADGSAAAVAEHANSLNS
jgi:hypothetical protein